MMAEMSESSRLFGKTGDDEDDAEGGSGEGSGRSGGGEASFGIPSRRGSNSSRNPRRSSNASNWARGKRASQESTNANFANRSHRGMSPESGVSGEGKAQSEAGQDAAQNARRNDNTAGPFRVVPKNPFDFSDGDDEGDEVEGVDESGEKQRGMLYKGSTDAELSEIESQRNQSRSLSSKEDSSLSKGYKDGSKNSLQNENNLSRAEERRHFMEVMGGGGSVDSKHEENPLFDGGDNRDSGDDDRDNDPITDARTKRSATVENYGDGNVYEPGVNEYEPNIDESLEKYATMRQVMDGSDRVSHIDVHRRGGWCAKCVACFESPCCKTIFGERRTQRRKVSVAILVCMILMFVVAGLAVYFFVIRGAMSDREVKDGTRGSEPEGAAPPSSVPTPMVTNMTNVTAGNYNSTNSTAGIADGLNSTVVDPASTANVANGVSTSTPSLAPISESTSTPMSAPSSSPYNPLGVTASPTVRDSDNSGNDGRGNSTNATAFPTIAIMSTPTHLPWELGDTPLPVGNASAPSASPAISITLDELSYPYVLSQQMESPLMPSLPSYGSSVAFSGDGRIVAVGATEATDKFGDASGAVYLYFLEEGSDSDKPQLLQAIYGQSANSEFGNAVALSNDGSRMAVGSRSEDDRTGAVWIYKKDDGAGTPGDALNDADIISIVGGADDGATTTQYPSSSRWSPMEGGLIRGSSPGGRAGWSVSISADGNVVAMGSPKGGSNGGGSIATYKFNSLTSAWEPYGSIVEGMSSGEEAGYSIFLTETGSTMVVGFPKATNLVGTVDAGKTGVYIMSESEWQLLFQEVYGEAESYIDGSSVAMSRDGTIVVIGGKGRNEANKTTGVLGSVGHCSIYQVQADQLIFQHSIAGKGAEERLGSSAAVSSDGNVAACGGAGGTKGGDSVNSGVVRLWNRVTMRESTIWPRGEIADLDGATFGTSLAISADGEYVMVGAPSWNLKNGGGTSAGAVQVFRDVA